MYEWIFVIQSLISLAIAWWSSFVTSGAPIDSSYSFIKSVNPSAAPDIDIIGVFKLCEIPPINCPREAKRSFSIRVSWLFLIVWTYWFCWVCIWLKAETKSPISSFDITGSLFTKVSSFEVIFLNPSTICNKSLEIDFPNRTSTTVASTRSEMNTIIK